LDGVLNLLKPPGMTSSNAVVDVRRLLCQKSVGHAGTLDPGAAGVLPICVGKATRLFNYLMEKEKEYRAEITFGIATDTLDSYGIITEKTETNVTNEQLLSVLPQFLGEQEQLPPMYSAIKQKGKKLYELARKGETVDLTGKERRVTIHALTLVDQTGPQSFLIDIRCSKGTYIRTLCEDIGKALSVPAYMSFLLRTRSGRFAVGDAVTIAELSALVEANRVQELLTPMDQAVDFLHQAEVEQAWFEKLKNGNPAPRGMLMGGVQAGVPLRVYCAGKFFGIGEYDGSMLRLKSMLYNE
jgi:tRNA pseudouridine55 synthase